MQIRLTIFMRVIQLGANSTCNKVSSLSRSQSAQKNSLNQPFIINQIDMNEYTTFLNSLLVFKSDKTMHSLAYIISLIQFI